MNIPKLQEAPGIISKETALEELQQSARVTGNTGPDERGMWYFTVGFAIGVVFGVLFGIALVVAP